MGLDGSLNGSSAMLVGQAIHAKGRKVVDMGAGDGRFMAAMLAGGKARSVLGYELPANHLQRDIFYSVLQKMTTDMKGFRFNSRQVKFMLRDINEVFFCFSTCYAYRW